MMRYKRKFNLLLLPLCVIGTLCGGCATLHVDVEILDSRYWTSPDWIDELGKKEIGARAAQVVDGQMARLQAKMDTQVDEVIHQLVVEDKADANTVGELSRPFYDLIAGEFGKASSIYTEALDELRNYEASQSNDRSLATGLNKVRAGDAVLATLPQTLAVSLRQMLSSFREPQIAAAEAKALENRAQNLVTGFTGGQGLFEDVYASAVINAPPKYWKGKFNQTRGWGGIGNVDIAIKMEELGNFTVKGVRNDAAAITKATFAVGQQAVQTVAALYGIPLPKTTATPTDATNPGAGNAIVAPEIESPAKKLMENEAKAEKLRQARIAFFEAIVAQRALAGSATEAERSEFATRAKAAIAAAKGDLAPTSPPSPGK